MHEAFRNEPISGLNEFMRVSGLEMGAFGPLDAPLSAGKIIVAEQASANGFMKFFHTRCPIGFMGLLGCLV